MKERRWRTTMEVVEEVQRKGTDGEQEEMTKSGDTCGSVAGLTVNLSNKDHCLGV